MYKLTPPAQNGGNWTEQLLYVRPANGKNQPPQSALGPLIMNSNGNLFGTSSVSGLFGLAHPTTAGAAWTYSSLWSFSSKAAPGNAQASILLDNAGNLFSTSRAGGVYGAGTVFEISNTGL